MLIRRQWGKIHIFQLKLSKDMFLPTDVNLWNNICQNICVLSRAWPIHRQHSPSGPIVGQSEPSANDDNRWPVRADVSRWFYSLNSPTCSHGLYRPPVQNYSRFRAVYVLMTIQALREVKYDLAWLGLASSVMRPGQQPMQYCSSYVFYQAVLLLPCWTNNHCPRPGLNVVIKHYWPSFPPPL